MCSLCHKNPSSDSEHVYMDSDSVLNASLSPLIREIAIPLYMIAIAAPCWTFELLHNKLDGIFAPDDPPLATERLPQTRMVRMLFW